MHSDKAIYRIYHGEEGWVRIGASRDLLKNHGTIKLAAFPIAEIHALKRPLLYRETIGGPQGDSSTPMRGMVSGQQMEAFWGSRKGGQVFSSAVQT